jgi:plasmid stabilization system protein ParE
MEIIVSKNVSKKLDKIVKYLNEEWGENAVVNFIHKYESLKDTLSVSPYVGEASSSKPVLRIILITKHNALFYKVENDRIYFIHIKDTRGKRYKR